MFWLGSSVLDEKVDRWVDGSVCVDNVVIMWIKKIDSKFRSIVNDQNRRKEFEKVELENLVIKSVVRSEGVRWDRLRLENLGRVGLIGSVYIKIKRKKGTLTRVRNRCIMTGRSSSLEKVGISRIMFRELAGLGKMPGLKKV